MAIVKNNIDIFMISETWFSFPKGLFQLHSLSESCRFNRNGNAGGILLFISEDIPSKPIESQMSIEGFFTELNLRRKNGSYVATAILSTLKYHTN